MATQTENTITFYELQTDIGRIEPYGAVSEKEFNSMIRRFVAWAAMIATHPNLVETFGEISTLPIRLATDLRAAINHSVKSGIYPNVILPADRFSVAMEFIGVARALEPEFQQIIARENQRWEEEFAS